ncbi:MAG: thiolase family protein [Spongiibacteraceae bacterium]
MMEINERKSAISGIGQSAVGRRLGRSALDLTVESSLAAITDAGLKPSDIDGVATWPGAMANPPGMSPIGVFELKDALRLELNWFSGGGESPGQLGCIVNACAAIAAGLATHVLCFRTVTETSSQTPERRASVQGNTGERARGLMQWALPFKAFSASIWTAQYAQRHFHEYGTTRKQLGWIAVNQRRNAGLNPKAIYRDPITIDDYLQARMITTPLCLLDCDVPVDGSTAILVSRLDAARDLRRKPIRFEAIGSAHHGRFSWDQHDDLTTQQAIRDSARMMWTRTDLKPADVDVAQVYDGFSITTLNWLEELGFCGIGEGGAFIEGGTRIALEGEIPVNTNGGQLSAGRTHGFGFVHEACTQLWGEGGAHQVKNDPQVAIAAAGGGIFGSSLLLVRDV